MIGMNTDFPMSKYSFQYNFSIHQTIDSNGIQKFLYFLEYKSIDSIDIYISTKNINVLFKEKQFISLKRIIDDYYWEPPLPQKKVYNI